MHKSKLFLIDAHSFCYRAFFAIKGLANSKGQPTGAIYGFTNILNKIVRENKPDYLAVCFDVGKKTFRSEKFKEYKINRPSMPDDLSSQIPIIKEVVSAYNYKIFEKEGFEADDVIATIADKLAKKADLEIFVVSADKDILQLLDKNIKIYNPYKEDPVFDTQKLKQAFGLTADRIIDMMALMGDASDNIPGIPGVGEKTALKLLQKFDSLEDLIKTVEKVDSPKLKESIIKFKEQAKLSKELARLVRDVPIEVELSAMQVKGPDKNKLFTLFKDLEFKSLLKELSDSLEDSKASESEIKNGAKDLKFFVEGLNNFSFIIDAGDEDPMQARIANVRLFKPESIIYLEEENIPKEIFEDDKIKKIAHDLKSAKILLKRKGIEIRGECFDTLLAAYCLDPGRNDYSIKTLAIENLKDSGANSAKLVWELAEKLREELKSCGLENLYYNIEIPLVDVLSQIQMHGVNLDLGLLEKLSKELDGKIKLLIKDIYSESGCEFNINSPKQLREVLFNKLKLKPVKRTKTGASTDEETLTKLQAKHPVVAYILQYRELAKLKSTYIDVLPQLVNGKTGRVHTSFNQAVTSTGRLSSSNPNLQNIPIRTELGRTIRKAFIPTDKKDLILSADYSQIELRILAHISGDTNLIKAFKNSEDIHRFTAALIFDVDKTEVDDQMRERAKRINFGIIYGMSVFGLAKDLDVSTESAQQFMDAYFLRYPKVKEYMENIIQEAKEKGFVSTLLGRRRYLPQIKSGNKVLEQFAARAAINAPIQGSAADMIKLAMIEIYQKLKEKKFKSAMILQVHDELVFEVSQDELNPVAEIVKDNMENVLKLSVPVIVDLKQGKNWLEIK